MSDIDLSAAVEAAARGLLASEQAGYKMPLGWESLAAISQHNMREAVLPIVTAAAPLIEAAVREQVAREIEAQVVRDDFGRVNTFGMGEQHAARIARTGA